ncbi:hypothetical protein POTOM_048949 [Populus tomentosa]|uniref:Protein yippee-like n=1 Tax=Populus tomentosa TaxID=118781 RepID=A0A8X7YBM6_POPTO|nr:hypothetical protein POTOM_048949 [Populus tomentosa]
MNIVVGPKEDRHLLTGLHTVADISCAECREVLGWKYERAYEASQKYKEGKYIFEKLKIVKENCSFLSCSLTMKSWIAGDSLATCLPELGEILRRLMQNTFLVPVALQPSTFVGVASALSCIDYAFSTSKAVYLYQKEMIDAKYLTFQALKSSTSRLCNG